MRFESRMEAVLHAKQALARRGVLEPDALAYRSHQEYFVDLRAYNQQIDRLLSEAMNGRIEKESPIIVHDTIIKDEE